MGYGHFDRTILEAFPHIQLELADGRMIYGNDFTRTAYKNVES